MDYQKIYNDLISKARSENRVKGKGVYYERHHIIPRCLGGEGNLASKKEHPNLVLLTAREHFIAHKLLYFIYTKNIKIARAFWAMISNKSKGRNYKVSSREYAELQEIAAKSISGKNNPLFKMVKNPFTNPDFIKKNSERQKNRVRTSEERKKISESKKGKKATEETKQKMSKTRKGRKRNPESVRKSAESNKGKKRSPEIIKMMSEVRIGVPAPHTSETNKKMNSLKFTCPYCNREIGGRANFVRYHNDNCKQK
jgi:flagellar biosynthesis GTPase FlhF